MLATKTLDDATGGGYGWWKGPTQGPRERNRGVRWIHTHTAQASTSNLTRRMVWAILQGHEKQASGRQKMRLGLGFG